MAHVADGHGLRRWLFSRLPLVAVATVLLAALLLMTDVQRETSHLNQLSLWIFGLTGVALIGLLLAIISQACSCTARYGSARQAHACRGG